MNTIARLLLQRLPVVAAIVATFGAVQGLAVAQGTNPSAAGQAATTPATAPASAAPAAAGGASAPTATNASTQAVAAATGAGSAEAGRKKADMCIGCHGIPYYQASFPEVYKVPMISGQNQAYIVAALTGYKKGERKHPTMRAIAASLSEQDMADLGAFYANQYQPTADAQIPPPSAAVDALLKKGNCISCHGADFSKPIDKAYPKLAGQHADYLYAALKAYQVDKNPNLGRSNAIMAGMARPFSHAELKQIANSISSLPGQMATVPQPRFKVGEH